jgi:hypothetical protein
VNRKSAGTVDIVVGRREMGTIECDKDRAVFKRREWVRDCAVTATDFSHRGHWRNIKIYFQSRGLGMVNGGPKAAPPAHTTIPRTRGTGSTSFLAVTGATVTLVCVASLPPPVPPLAAASYVTLAKEKNKQRKEEQSTHDNNCRDSPCGDPIIVATGTGSDRT